MAAFDTRARYAAPAVGAFVGRAVADHRRELALPRNSQRETRADRGGWGRSGRVWLQAAFNVGASHSQLHAECPLNCTARC
jgi:hypothetical protein